MGTCIYKHYARHWRFIGRQAKQEPPRTHDVHTVWGNSSVQQEVSVKGMRCRAWQGGDPGKALRRKRLLSHELSAVLSKISLQTSLGLCMGPEGRRSNGPWGVLSQELTWPKFSSQQNNCVPACTELMCPLHELYLSSAWVVLTEYHRLRSLNNRNSFFTAL